ncbi:hypothetical protein D3C71_1717930 [compost metagenome]
MLPCQRCFRVERAARSDPLVLSGISNRRVIGAVRGYTRDSFAILYAHIDAQIACREGIAHPGQPFTGCELRVRLHLAALVGNENVVLHERRKRLFGRIALNISDVGIILQLALELVLRR